MTGNRRKEKYVRKEKRRDKRNTTPSVAGEMGRKTRMGQSGSQLQDGVFTLQQKPFTLQDEGGTQEILVQFEERH